MKQQRNTWKPTKKNTAIVDEFCKQTNFTLKSIQQKENSKKELDPLFNVSGWFGFSYSDVEPAIQIPEDASTWRRRLKEFTDDHRQ